MRALAGTLGLLLGLALGGLAIDGCHHTPDPKVLGYTAEAELCARRAAAMDAGRPAKWAAYDQCEHEAYRLWGGP